MRTLYFLYALSGLVSLGYQVAWFRIFVDRFGSTNLTFGLVLADFIGGLGVGALLSRRVTRFLQRALRTAHPLRLYGRVELLIAATALFTVATGWIPASAFGAFPYALEDGVHQPTLGYALSHFAITTVCVFVPCFLMGVTFPLLCDAFRDRPRFPAALYAWNTLGACAGILACEALLIPWFGHDSTFVLMVGLNVALGGWFVLARSLPGDERAAAAIDAPEPAPAARSITPAMALTAAIVGGFLTGAFEADVLRRLQFLGCRTPAALAAISFWAILAIFGASVAVRAAPRLRFATIQAGYGAALLIYVLLWQFAYPLRDWANAGDQERVVETLRDTTGLGITFRFFEFGYGLGSVLLFTGLFVFPAFCLLSLLLPWVCNAMQRERRHLGLVYGANTAAFCAGILAFTLLAPRVDVFYSLKLFHLCFAVLVALLAVLRPWRSLARWKPTAAVGALALGCAIVPRGFDASFLPPDSAAVRHSVRALRSNGTHTTYVVGDPSGDLLFFDSHSMSGCNLPSQQYMRLMAHFPLLAQPAPGKALLICFGVGSTAAAIAAHDAVRQIDVVDLNDQVFATAPEFAAVNQDVVEDPRVRLIHDDGRRYLDLTDEVYDLITSEPPPPMFAGMHRLYSREYYEAVRDALSEGGLMTQWLPITQMPSALMEQAIATFVAVFPDALLFVGSGINYILMGGKRPIDLGTVEERFAAEPRVARDLQRFGIVAPVRLFARIAMAGPSLAGRYGAARPISDQGNDFARAFHDPRSPSVIPYDPIELLGELELGELECAEELRGIVCHLGRLKSVAWDFPEAALTTVPTEHRAAVALAGIDWPGVARVFEASKRAAGEGRLPEALALMARVGAVARDVPVLAYWLATLETRAGRHEAALATLQQALRIDPGDVAAHQLAGWNLLRLSRAADALAHLRQAVEHDPQRGAEPARLLGDALAALARWREADAAYEEALRRDPGHAAAREGRARCRAELAR